MKPLAELRPAGPIRGLFFDIDDTLTTDGRLTAGAYGALERLRDAGLTRGADHRPSRRLVRPHRADVAGRRRGRRERRVLLPLRPRGRAGW